MKLKVSEDGSLYGRAGRALGWSFASTALGRLSTLAIGIAIARLLGPAEFGTFAVATVALMAVLSFNELGVSLAIVRWPGDPREIAPTVATISVISSVLVYVGCFLGAPAFASAMGEPGATPVVRLLAVSVILDGLLATPAAMLQRKFRQDRKTVVDQVTHWTGSLTSIALAISGLGAMSLAVGRLTGALAGGLLLVRFEWASMRFGLDRTKARELMRFGLPLAGSSILVFTVNNVDRLLVGAVLGPVPLGYYVLASNLAGWPVSIFSSPVRAVAPAALSRLQNDRPVMHRTFLSTAGLLVAVTLPACVLLSAAAEPLVRFVYGSVWQPAATVLPWLGLLAALRIIFELIYDYFVVLASSRVVFTAQVIWLAALVPALYVGATLWELPGAGIAQLVVGLLVVLPIYLYELNRTGVHAGAFAAQLIRPVLGAAAVGLIVFLISGGLRHDLLALVLAGLVGMSAIVLLVYQKRDVLRSLRAVGAAEPEPSAEAQLALRA
ncbi:lipopolysaccharide biosynthesis protein [Micromonospora chersina]|uniref:lipopolysaccharide biosynthesis protein n=1 Tax=Micromonospora chersina TaxID=47854 RepID=UPI00371F65B2